MQYGRFRPEDTINPELNAFSFGKLLEQGFDRREIPTELPTAADWGYTFRAKVGKQLFDISVVDHGEDGFGIALEPPKDIISRIFHQHSKKAVANAKNITSEVLSKIAPDATLTWFSKDEWLAAFETDFWQ